MKALLERLMTSCFTFALIVACLLFGLTQIHLGFFVETLLVIVTIFAASAISSYIIMVHD